MRDGRTGKLLAEVALPDWQWAGEPYSCDAAIAVGPGGEVLVTSDVVPTLWRIDPLLRRAQKIALDAPVAGACHITLRNPEGLRPSGLCILGSEGMATVELAPDQRSGYVRLRLPCVPPAGEAASGSDRSRAP